MSCTEQLLFDVAFYVCMLILHRVMLHYVIVYVCVICVYHLSSPIQFWQLDVTFVLPSCFGWVYLL